MNILDSNWLDKMTLLGLCTCHRNGTYMLTKIECRKAINLNILCK